MNVLERFKNDEVVVLNTPHAREVLTKLGLRKGLCTSQYLIIGFLERNKFFGFRHSGDRELVDISEFEKLLKKDLPQPEDIELQDMDKIFIEKWPKAEYYMINGYLHIKKSMSYTYTFYEQKEFDKVYRKDESGEYQLIAERKKSRIPTDADKWKKVRARNSITGSWHDCIFVAVDDRTSRNKYLTCDSSYLWYSNWKYAELID